MLFAELSDSELVHAGGHVLHRLVQVLGVTLHQQLRDPTAAMLEKRQKERLKKWRPGAVRKPFRLCGDTWSERRRPAGFVWLGSTFENESMETGADLSREDIRLLDHV